MVDGSTDFESGVAITGTGAVSAVGLGASRLDVALAGALDGIRAIERFSTEGFQTHLGATVPGFDEPQGGLTMDFALLAAREALAQAKIAASVGRVGLVLGVSLGDGDKRLARLTERLARELGIAGPRVTVSTACTSSSNAVGLGKDLLDAGAVDVVLAGGTDVLTPELFAGFHALGVLGSRACAPYSRDFGTTLGEGAGFVVLERVIEAKRRGADILGLVLGYGLSCDAYHATSPDPTGAGVARAIRFALADAGVSPQSIGYVNAHGTGTDANDAAEVKGIDASLGATSVPVSSSKSFLGHAQGAAGILELLVTLAGLRAQRLPPTTRLSALRRGAPVDPVPEPRSHAFDVALTLNSAFAGANSAVVLASGQARARAASQSRPVFVVGIGALVGGLTDMATIARRVLSGERIERRAGECDVRTSLPRAEPRGLDRSTRFAATTCARALADADIAVTGDLRGRAGVIGAATTGSAESGREFYLSIEQRGLARLNANAFARLVLNAPTGAAARLLSLRGPTSTITTGQGGGVIAVAYAARLLSRAPVAPGSTSADVSVMLGVGFDELGEIDEETNAAEGAGAVVLSVAPGPVRLVSWVMGAPGDGARATVDRAVGLHGASDIDLVLSDGPVAIEGGRVVDLTQSLGNAPSACGTVACAVATHLVRAGSARRVLIATRGGGASAALLIEREAA